MNQAWLYTFVSVIIVSLISFAGVLTLSMKAAQLKRFLLYMVSFSAGTLFGDAFIHLLPEAIEEFGFGLEVSITILCGIVFMFIIEKFIHWRHCHVPTSKEHAHPFAHMNLVGDAAHNLIDGVIIAGSYLVSIPVGVATTIAIVMHEVPQEIGDFGVLLHGGYSKSKAILFNFLTAATSIVGAVIGLVASMHIEGIERFMVPLAAGAFIYIAGADLIPEMHKEVSPGKSVLQLLAFLAGVGVMAALLLVEIGH